MTRDGHDRDSAPTIAGVIAAQAARTPLAWAIQALDREPLTYARLQAAVGEVAASLHARGLGPGDRVALVLPNGPEMAVAFLAVASSMTCVPLNPGYREDDFAFSFSDLGVKAVIVQPDETPAAVAAARSLSLAVVELVPSRQGPAGLFALRCEARDPPVTARAAEPDDIALVLHTSGTTARPKIVPLSQRNLCLSAEGIRRTLVLTGDNACLNVMPLFHIHGLVGALLSTIAAGASIACATGFRGRDFFAWMRRTRATWYTAVPTIHQAVLEAAAGQPRPIEGCHLRFVRSSSAPLAPRTMEDLAAVFRVPVIEAYGMTEGSHQMASNPLEPGRQKPGSVGLPAGPEIAILLADGRLAERKAVGEIVIRGETVTSGYESNPEANAAAFSGGWFRTGDQGFFDDDGYLFLTGRLKELINRGGEKIAPREVEEALLRHAGVAQAVVFAVPHERLGEEVGAAVVLRAGATAAASEIREAARRHLPSFKVPRVVAVVEEIPKGATGKVQRRGLAEKLGLVGPTTGCGGPPRSALEVDLAREWSRLLEIEGIGVEDDFFALGGDSLAATEMIAAASELLEMDVPIVDFLEQPTIARLVELRERGAGGEIDTSGAPIALHAGGSGPPIFGLSPHNGNLWQLSRLLRLLGGDWPIYGIRPPPVGARDRPLTVEELAERNLTMVLAIEPQQRLVLIGHCFGGTVAYEMARQLHRMGRPAPLLVMINSFNRAWRRAEGAPPSARVHAAHLMRRLRHHASMLDGLDPRARIAYLRTRARQWMSDSSSAARQQLFDLLTRAGLSRPPSLRATAFASSWALERYQPGPYSGDILMVQSTVPTAGVYPLPHMGWGALASGSVETIEVPCDRLGLWSDPESLHRIAAAIRIRLLACPAQPTPASPHPEGVIPFSPGQRPGKRASNPSPKP